MRLMYDKKMALTKNFSMNEFIVSREHPELIRNVILTEDQILKFYYHALWLLQPCRDVFGRIIITSAYRNHALNEVLGGATDSQHMFCEAVDWVPKDSDAAAVMAYATSHLQWAGEMILYPAENRIHSALPHPDVNGEHLIVRVGGRYEPYVG